MWRLKGILVYWNGYKPKASVPDPWYDRLSRLRQVLLVIDGVLALVGMVAAILGIPFGVPILGGAITLFMFIQVGRHVIVQAESTGLSVETPPPTFQRGCPECGEWLDNNPNYCFNCDWESENPIKP